ncbi:MAG TPA: GTP-binding protein [Actinoallomurus sp.]|nr:GTP-binding protein [Actinoallomurus sp.]
MQDLHVTIATGMAADLGDLLCARTRAFGVAVARYRHRRDILTRTYGGEQVHLPVAHCVSCTLREDLPRFLSGVAGRHERLLLILPEIADPLDAATAIDTADVGVRIDTVAMIADLATITHELAGGETLADRGIAGAATDGRTVSSVLARQAETADLFLTWAPPHTDPFDAAIGHSLLTHLSPWAPSLDLEAVTDLAAPAGKPAFDLHAVHERTQPGGALPGCPDPEGPVSTLIWRSRRPFHPERLYAALEPVLDTGIVRARGHLWLASHPLTLLSWESAGETLAIEPAGRWLHSADPATWRHASPIRRTTASLDWHPQHGDRRTEIRFTGIDIATTELRLALDEAVLTDTEMTTGEHVWARLPDPFTPWLGPTTAEPDTRRTA